MDREIPRHQSGRSFERELKNMTPEMAYKIDHALGFKESTMAIIQAMYDTKIIKNTLSTFFTFD